MNSRDPRGGATSAANTLLAAPPLALILKDYIESLTCPLTDELFLQPICLTACGHTFEQHAFEQYCEKTNQSSDDPLCCPGCEAACTNDGFAVNYKVKHQVGELLKKLPALQASQYSEPAATAAATDAQSTADNDVLLSLGVAAYACDVVAASVSDANAKRAVEQQAQALAAGVAKPVKPDNASGLGANANTLFCASAVGGGAAAAEQAVITSPDIQSYPLPVAMLARQSIANDATTATQGAGHRYAFAIVLASVPELLALLRALEPLSQQRTDTGLQLRLPSVGGMITYTLTLSTYAENISLSDYDNVLLMAQPSAKHPIKAVKDVVKAHRKQMQCANLGYHPQASASKSVAPRVSCVGYAPKDLLPNASMLLTAPQCALVWNHLLLTLSGHQPQAVVRSPNTRVAGDGMLDVTTTTAAPAAAGMR